MIHKALFILSHNIGDRSFYSKYLDLRSNQWNTYADLKFSQEQKLRALIEYAYDQVPYYRDLLKTLSLLPKDIRSIEDLGKLPILTKDLIKANWEAFKPANLSHQKYFPWATGGSTGTPMQFRVSRHDRYLAAALLYRGWGYGGYTLGDRMVFLAGSSINVGTKPWLAKKGHEITRNIRQLSSFDMTETKMRQYAGTLTDFSPRYIRGYASSIHFFAQWLEASDIAIPAMDGIFTTAEKLYPHMRETIEKIFDCEVFDNYGLNDGGVSAYECEEHTGLHVDTERGIMEIVDWDNQQIVEGEGKILATSLENFAMPFIRYDTGDVGLIENEKCPCGRSYSLLRNILGRQQEMLITPDGKRVHGAFINHIFFLFPFVKEFQVIQLDANNLIFNIVSEREFGFEEKEKVRSILRSQQMGWDVEFNIVDKIDRSKGGKYKYIINKMTERY